MLRRHQHWLILLAPVAVFIAMVVVDRTFGAPGRGRDYVIHIALAPSGGEIGLPKIDGPPDAARPLVVIDAGHGGKDPGAGAGSLKEKALTLALAKALRDRLLEMGGIRVALTRSDDSYLFLAERTGIARRLKADLFLSIHADSTEGSLASGATVYTLSEKGTNEVAQKLAVQENRADEINGVKLTQTSDTVSAILIDLAQRETQARSEEFAGLLLREGRGRIGFREGTVQSAAFAVLKSPDLASVLFESGYINNGADAARLMSEAGRGQFADVTAGAIRAYFARQSAN